MSLWQPSPPPLKGCKEWDLLETRRRIAKITKVDVLAFISKEYIIQGGLPTLGTFTYRYMCMVENSKNV